MDFSMLYSGEKEKMRDYVKQGGRVHEEGKKKTIYGTYNGVDDAADDDIMG